MQDEVGSDTETERGDGKGFVVMGQEQAKQTILLQNIEAVLKENQQLLRGVK